MRMENTISRKLSHNAPTICFRKNCDPCSFHCFWKGSVHCPSPRTLSLWRTEINSGSWQVPGVMLSFSQLPHTSTHRAKDFHGLGLLRDLFPGPSHGTITGFVATCQLKPTGEFTFLGSIITAYSNWNGSQDDLSYPWYILHRRKHK